MRDVATSGPVLEAKDVSKRYGAIQALSEVSLEIHAGQVTCLLGDNGAGKSTLIKIFSGVLGPDAGEIFVDDEPVVFRSPTEALDRGIATVFQDLAVVPTLAVYRNFVLGREPTKGRLFWRRLDHRGAKALTSTELTRIGITLEDVKRPIATLSGGQRQAVVIARAIHYGARVLVLDEPTSALGVREARTVLRYIRQARERGIAVLFITHNVHHAYPLGDSFTILRRGEVAGRYVRGELTRNELANVMASGEDLEQFEEDEALEKELAADIAPAAAGLDATQSKPENPRAPNGLDAGR
jgi:simple sugar transport system ATP-binding protein